MPHVPTVHRLVVAVFAVLLVCLGAIPAEAAEGHLPPVEGTIADPWRPPATGYGAGNRGVDFRTRPDGPVVASAAGEVTFAGPVGGFLHVVVLHPDGIRTSYSFLRSIAVERGSAVTRGEVLGTTAERIHLGARAGDRYIDPSLLWGGDVGDVHLVPTGPTTADGTDERSWMAGVASGSLAWGPGARRWATGLASRPAPVPIGSAVAILAGLATSATGPGMPGVAASSEAAGWARAVAHVRSMWAGAEAFERSQDGCTPPGEVVPPPTGGRRIVVLVAGFGSAGGRAGVLDLDTATLGYHPDDVVQFSYRGGRVDGVGGLDGVPVSAYRSSDAMGDLPAAGRHLRALLVAVAASHPGVPIDVVAHSQGGLVARAALGEPVGEPGPLASVAHLVTLGSPHDGADLASAGAALAATRAGGAIDRATARLWGDPVGATSVATSQLAEGSAFLRSLATAPVPPAVRTTSIAARGDLVAPALHSALPGATHALVPLAGPSAHGALPGDAATLREVGLALAGAGPTCQELGPDLLLAAAISLAEDGAGWALGAGARSLDAPITERGLQGGGAAVRPGAPGRGRSLGPEGHR